MYKEDILNEMNTIIDEFHTVGNIPLDHEFWDLRKEFERSSYRPLEDNMDEEDDFT